MRRVHIETKSLTSVEAVDRLRAALAGRAGTAITTADAAVATGLPLADAEQALLALTTRHPCRVNVTDDGVLVVRFSDLSVRRERGPLGRFVDKARAWLSRHRDRVLAAFAVTIFPVLALLGLIGAFGLAKGIEAGGLDNHEWATIPLTVLGGGAGLFWLVGILAVVFVAMLTYIAVALLLSPIWFFGRPLFDAAYAADFELGTHLLVSTVGSVFTFAIGFVAAGHLVGYWRKVFAGESVKWAPRFWRALGGFLFGPPRDRPDTLADERLMLARIQELGGVVTTADLMGLFGWDPGHADSQIVRVMMDYGGDVMVTDKGAVLWVFPAIAQQSLGPTDTRSTAGQGVFRVPIVRKSRFFGCRLWVAIVSVILLVPAILGPLVHPWLVFLPTPSEMFVWHGPFDRSDPGMQALGAWPALLILAGLLARVPAWVRRRWAERSDVRELAFIQMACDSPEGAWTVLAKGDTAIIARLDGDLSDSRTVDARTEHLVVFPKVAAAFAEAEIVRRGGASALAATEL